MFHKYYEPSKKVPFIGMILLIAVFITVGSALAWVYLWFNRVCTVVIVDVFAAIGYGVLIGFLGRLIVKKCKIANPVAAILGILIGVIGMTYIKWGMYDYYDYQTFAEQYEEYVSSAEFSNDLQAKIKEIKADLRADSTDAYTFFEMNYDFDEYTFEENYNYLQNNAYDAFSYVFKAAGKDLESTYTESQLLEMKECTLYEWFYYDLLLGKTKDECEKNVENARNMTAYEFLESRGFDIDAFIAEYYYGVTEDKNSFEEIPFETPTMLEVLSDPGKLWKDIKQINDEGRWSYTSSSYSTPDSDPSDEDLVNGVLLWIVWIGELLIIDLCAIFIAYSQAKKIFIEKDNNWAEVFDGGKLIFANMSKLQLKSMLEQNPDNITSLTPVDPVQVAGRPHVKLTISHSKDYSENYLNGYNMVYNSQSGSYNNIEAFTGLVITPKQAGVLLSMFGIEPMGAIATDAEYLDWSRSGSSMSSTDVYGGYAQPQMPQAAQPVTMDSAVETCGSCGEKIPAGKKFCPHCGAPLSDDRGSDMAGL